MGEIPWKRKWQPTPAFFPGKSREERSLVGYTPWGRPWSWTPQKSWTPPGDLTTTTFVEYILVVKMNVCGTLYFYYIYL